MKLSVIIVNYNVRYFLEQALLSVERALVGISSEIYVVDNNSSDSSIEMVRTRFPTVKLIENKKNTGFAVANNQAFASSAGEFVLLLNPDTVVSEDTFQKCLAAMSADETIGGIGVKSVDGSGKFLPESKRGFPTSWVAFCKAFGLSALFPKSKIFNHYYLGNLSENESNYIEILVGSFMFLRRSCIEKLSFLLDEAYFMYGEDIDLSYRILQSGFKNYYIADTTIIHYKGESTKKGSLNYVRTFYNAMIIFALKNLPRTNAWLYVSLIQFAVWFRAVISVVSYFFKSNFLPLLDTLLIVTGLIYLRAFWSNYYFQDNDYIKPQFFFVNVPIYTATWLVALYFSGGYDVPIAMRRVFRGIVVGTLLNASVYGLLNLSYRSSRMILLLGAVWAFCATVLVRWLASKINKNIFIVDEKTPQKLVVVGDGLAAHRAKNIWLQKNPQGEYLGDINSSFDSENENSLGDMTAMGEIVQLYNPNEVIFCAQTIPYHKIIETMSVLSRKLLTYKILNPNSDILIGSSDKNERTAFETSTPFEINSQAARRNKRLLDVAAAFIILMISPYFYLLPFKSAQKIIPNVFDVLLNRKTWVGYIGSNTLDLPPLKPSVLAHADVSYKENMPYQLTVNRLNSLYAKHYTVSNDVKILWRTIIQN